MPFRFELPEGKLSYKEYIEMFVTGTVEFTLLGVAILAAVYVTLGFGTWIPL